MKTAPQSPLFQKPKENCRSDMVRLGEVMLLLDPGDFRVSTAWEFRVWEGGGDYNLARR
jgi:2-dehydro-3-deoxygluconokinase